MLMFLQQYKEQIFNIVESIHILLFFTIIVGRKDFFYKNKIGTVTFILLFTICGFLIDVNIPKGYNTLVYALYLYAIFALLINETLFDIFLALFLCIAFIVISEIVVSMFFSTFIIKKGIKIMLYDLKYFSIVASFLSVIRFFIIYFLYKSSFNLKKSFFFKRLTPFLLAIIAQMFVFSIFGSLTYLRIYEHSPILYEQFCFIIILISFILSFIIFKSKERQLKLQYELKYKEKLAIVNERNRISRELHDTLGHTLTLLITLIKSSRINIKKDTEGTEKKLVQAASIASEGLKQIRTTISGWLPDKLNSSPITTEINKLIEFAKDIGIEIDFSVYGEERIVATGYSDVLYKICREAITNSLRHGKAKKVTIVLKFFQEKIQLFITDDGIGCNNIKKGFGLIGIEERVNDMNGTLTYGTTGDRGFNIHAKFPISKEGFR